MFASTAIDFLVKPFDVERFEAALALATSTIAHMRTEFGAEERSSQQKQNVPQRQFLQRLAVELERRLCWYGERSVLDWGKILQFLQSSKLCLPEHKRGQRSVRANHPDRQPADNYLWLRPWRGPFAKVIELQAKFVF
jgi:hypothetical protein